jgi:ACS family hexuronate transporter-like MFS transporter
MKKIPNYRWWIAAFLAFTTAFSYFDRQSFPIAVVEIQKNIPLTNQQYSELQMLFLCAYSLMYAGGGKLADYLGTRYGYFLMILWWSIATILHGFVSTVFGLGTARFLLGLGEGGGFPCSAKAISEWFPQKDRSSAFGIFNSGSSIGAVIAPPMIAFIAVTLNWRWVFFFMGGLGVLWSFAWLRLYDLPSRHRLITVAEQQYIQRALSEADIEKQTPTRWRTLLSFRQMWALCITKFLTDAAWFFFIFWLPKYLADVRHLNIKQIGYYAWIPYLFAGVGSFAGGVLSSYLIRRNLSIGTSRKLCLCISAIIMPVVLLITRAPLSLAIVFFSMALFGHQFWSTIVQTLPTDLFPTSSIGTAAGLMGAVGSFGAALANVGVGKLLTHYQSYAPVFLIAALVYPISLAFLFVLIPQVRQLHIDTGRRESLGSVS